MTDRPYHCHFHSPRPTLHRISRPRPSLYSSLRCPQPARWGCPAAAIFLSTPHWGPPHRATRRRSGRKTEAGPLLPSTPAPRGAASAPRLRSEAGHHLLSDRGVAVAARGRAAAPYTLRRACLLAWIGCALSVWETPGQAVAGQRLCPPAQSSSPRGKWGVQGSAALAVPSSAARSAAGRAQAIRLRRMHRGLSPARTGPRLRDNWPGCSDSQNLSRALHLSLQQHRRHHRGPSGAALAVPSAASRGGSHRLPADGMVGRWSGGKRRVRGGAALAATPSAAAQSGGCVQTMRLRHMHMHLGHGPHWSRQHHRRCSAFACVHPLARQTPHAWVLNRRCFSCTVLGGPPVGTTGWAGLLRYTPQSEARSAAPPERLRWRHASPSPYWARNVSVAAGRRRSRLADPRLRTPFCLELPDVCTRCSAHR